MKTYPLHTARLFILLIVSLVAVMAFAEEKPLTLYGRIKESVFKNDLPEAWVYTIDENGNRKDSLTVWNKSNSMFSDGVINDFARISFLVERKDSVYVFEVGCEGYTPRTVVYKVENVGDREDTRNIPDIYLDRAPHKLREVEVTASKIKFYHRGDTIVYNADAFQLADGSMLDALISQLPGVELSDNGRITVNGEFVESLLLNGKHFFDGNNNIMLQNIGAYTVKNVEVYRGHSLMEKFHDNLNAPKRLTMDVKLKKEYSIGWIANAQAGYGTESRFMGRLFSAWFTSSTEVVFLGNINNLNDNREPGKNSSWTPEQMPSGTRRYQLAGFNYQHRVPSGNRFARGNITYEGNRLNSSTVTDRTNFFSTGNTYDYSSAGDRYKDFKVRTNHSFGRKFNGVSISADVAGSYSRTDNTSSSLSATFDSEQSGMSLQALEAVYATGLSEQLSSIINRSRQLNNGLNKAGSVNGGAMLSYKIPQSPDRIYAQMAVSYSSRKSEAWHDINVNYSDNSIAGIRQRNYTYGSPDSDFTLRAGTGYNWRKGMLSGAVKYDYNFHNRDRDSYMYALERLGDDMGVYGELPAGYQSCLDAGNSYTSRLCENKHTLSLELMYLGKLSNGNSLQIRFEPNVGVLHSNLHYFSDNKAYPVSRTSALFSIADLGGSIRYQWGGPAKKSAMQILTLKYGLDTGTPDLLHLVDVTNTSDPLNISVGNPDLKNSHTYKMGLFYMISPKNYMSNTVTVDFSVTDNALVRGYYYDKTTGVRYNKTYNVSGNNSLKAENVFNLQFGRRKQFTLSSATVAGNIHSVDMVGTDGMEPAPSKVDTRTLSENIRVSWQIGKHSLSLNGVVSDRRTTSSRDGFNDINATHYNYGVTGSFALPAGFGISTDFRLYTRRGYGMRQLDTTDAVWNARATYTPRGGRWVFTLDGFDLLRRLNNIHYAVTATGRTVTYTNTLPRYILFSVQYRLNIQPKK
ncbi:outer membrane beta-barrel protein [Duncaniella freteri]|uniref:outer membrane beta-barrel protein n=1 Tax=Duncaniella freteri TaxID=2530391 RepID=UPI002573A269|nr:outer membrane beta-barrel protein [Duncaniella freteri]